MTNLVDTDVLIVGAGPTGLMLANQLARRGIRTIIIDRHPGPARETRALGVQARTMEIYAQLGIVDKALELGKRGTGANLWAEGRHMARVPLGDAGQGMTPYPYILVLGQDDNERIMGERLHDWGLSVLWNTELVSLEQQADQATASVKLADGSTKVITAAWVAGCDGARSAVRELSGITFPGAPYEDVFFVADTVATGDMVADEVNVYLWESGFHLFFPMRGVDHWRLVGILPVALRDRQDVDFNAVVPSITQHAGATLDFKACSWFSTYRIHHRSASHFRDRRVFLLGDAAHIHSPMGAQGMNTGLQDAYNLGWKLALVVCGKTDATLLDSYEQERMPVAQKLLATTDRGFRLVVSNNWFAGLLRTQILARAVATAMRLKRLQAIAFRAVSQIGIQYRDSALSRTMGLPHDAPQAGERFPWLHLKMQGKEVVEDIFQVIKDVHFNLIVIGQSAPGLPESYDVLRLHLVALDPANDAELARMHIPQPSFYLLRPDGYIGLCGTRLEASIVTRYLSLCLGFK